ncbi:hypothetical protein ACT7DF_15800 [Bacillus cereus]
MGKLLNLFRDMKVAKKLLISFFVILIAAVSIIGGMSYQTAKKNFESQIKSSANDNIKILDNLINQMIDAKFNDVNNFARVIQGNMYQGDNQDELRKMLSQYINLNKDIEQVYVAGNDKNLYKNQIYKWQQTMIQQSVLGIKMRLKNKVVLLLLSHIRQKEMDILS